jgi:diacylglycerol kinase family enzyme
VQALADALRPRGIACRTIWDPAERDAFLKSFDMANKCCGIIAAGGDGTVRDVLARRPAVPVAVLPLGLENLFARQLGFSRNVGALACAVATGRSHAIDLAQARASRPRSAVHSRECVALLITAGFDAHVVHRLAQWRARTHALERVTHLSYVRPILEAVRDYDDEPVLLEADGVAARGAHAIVCNFPRYAMGLRFTPEARPDDGLLDWILFQRPGVRNVLNYVCAVARGAHLGRPDVLHGRAVRIRLSSAAPVPVQIDGDPAGHTPVTVDVVPRAIQVVTMPSKVLS